MGSGSMRAQLSLLFTDKELYENFIVPSKNNRMLHSIILKCLTAYYYNVEVRNQIDGVEVNNTEVDNGQHIRTQQENINNIRDILTMQGFLSEELSNTMQDGIDDFTDALDRVNKTAVDIGAMSAGRNEYGAKTVVIKALVDKSMGMPNEDGEPETEEVILPHDFMDTISEMSTFMEQVKESGLLSQLNNKTTETVEKVEEVVDNEKQELNLQDENEEDSTDTVEVKEVKKPTMKRGNKKATKVEETVEEPIVEEEPLQEVAPPPEVPSEPVLGEASDALKELFESL